MWLRAARVVGLQQQRRHERAAFGAGPHDVHVVRVAEHDPARRQQGLDRTAHLLALLQAGQRTHLHAFRRRVAHHHLGQPLARRLRHLVRQRGRDEGPPDRGALLAGLDRHLGDQLPDIQVELRSARSGLRAEDGAVQRVRLGVEPYRPRDDGRVSPQLPGGGGGPGERHQVLLTEMIEQVADAAADQLDRAFRQQPGVHDQLHQPARHVRRLGGRLDQAGHPGDERGGELLQRTPDREVERVDLHRDPVQRGQDVLADESPALAQRLDRPLGENRVVRQLAPGLAGVAEQHADAAVDVELGVPEGRPCASGQGVQLRAVLAQQQPERLEQRGPLVESQLAQRRTARRPAVVERRRQVDAGRRYPGDLLAGHRIEHRPPVIRRIGPCPTHVAVQRRHRPLPSAGRLDTP